MGAGIIFANMEVTQVNESNTQTSYVNLTFRKSCPQSHLMAFTPELLKFQPQIKYLILDNSLSTSQQKLITNYICCSANMVKCVWFIVYPPDDLLSLILIKHISRFHTWL